MCEFPLYSLLIFFCKTVWTVVVCSVTVCSYSKWKDQKEWDKMWQEKLLISISGIKLPILVYKNNNFGIVRRCFKNGLNNKLIKLFYRKFSTYMSFSLKEFEKYYMPEDDSHLLVLFVSKTISGAILSRLISTVVVKGLMHFLIV